MDKSKQSCQICKKKFTTFVSQHVCKRCLRTTCKDCCNKKRNVFTKPTTKIQQHRCCDICLPQTQAIGQYIKSHALMFNALSRQGKQWAQLAQIQVTEGKTIKSNTSKTKLDGVYFHDIWGQMTPSLRQLSGILVSKIPLANVDTSVRFVVQKIGSLYCQQILPLIVYLLCHCDTPSTIKIAGYLTKISNNFNQKTIITYIQYLSTSNDQPLDQKSIKSLVNYCKNIYKFYVLSYFANCSQIDVIHHVVFQTLLSGDSAILQLAMAIILFDFRKEILGNLGQKPEQLKNLIWQTLNHKHLQKSVKKLRKIIIKNNPTKQNQPKQQQQQQIKKTRSMASLSKIQNFKTFSPTKLSLQLQLNTNQSNNNQSNVSQQIPNVKQVLSKLQQASQFLQQMQQKQVDQDLTAQNMQDLQRYLDMVIEDNQKSLRQYEIFQEMLAKVQGQLYGTTEKSQN